MFYRNNGYFTRHCNCNSCSNMTFDECDMETKCNNVQSDYNMNCLLYTSPSQQD